MLTVFSGHVHLHLHPGGSSLAKNVPVMEDVKADETVGPHVVGAIHLADIVIQVHDETAETIAAIATTSVVTVTGAAAPMAIARWKTCAMIKAAKKTSLPLAPMLSARVGGLLASLIHSADTVQSNLLFLLMTSSTLPSRERP